MDFVKNEASLEIILTKYFTKFNTYASFVQ